MGLGAGKGMHPLQHVEWAKAVQHPSSKPPDHVTQELLEALKFEIDTEAEDVDQCREAQLHKWIKRAKDMAGRQRRWAAQAHPSNASVVRQINGPLLESLLEEMTGD